MIKQLFENIKYESYPINDSYDDLPIEYKQRLFTKWPIYRLTDNIIERLRVISIKRLFDNRKYRSNPQMSILMTNLLMAVKGWSLYDNYIVYMMISYLGWKMVQAFTHKKIKCKKNNTLVRCIYPLTIKTVHNIT